jgi:hypothetical protein
VVVLINSRPGAERFEPKRNSARYGGGGRTAHDLFQNFGGLNQAVAGANGSSRVILSRLHEFATRHCCPENVPDLARKAKRKDRLVCFGAKPLGRTLGIRTRHSLEVFESQPVVSPALLAASFLAVQSRACCQGGAAVVDDSFALTLAKAPQSSSKLLKLEAIRTSVNSPH